MTEENRKNPLVTCGRCAFYLFESETCGHIMSEHPGDNVDPDEDSCGMFRPAPGILPSDLREGQGLIESAKRIQDMAGQMRLLADMLRETNARMAAMEKTIRTLEKVTPRQAAEINARIRERAAEVCREYRAGGQEKAAAAAIRKDVRNMTGVRTAREIARCDFGTVTEAIRDWDDYQVMKKIRQKGGARG